MAIKNKHRMFFLLFPFLILISCRGRNFGALYQQSVRSSLTLKRERKRLEDFVLSDKERVTYLGTIRISTRFADHLPLRIYYRGDIVPCIDGSFKFSGSRNLSTIYIIVTRIKAPTHTTIDHLEVPPGIPYLLYTLKKEAVFGAPEKDRWTINKIESSEGVAIPQDSLIILLDPHYIETLEPTTWKREGKFIHLPTIVLKKDSSLKDESIKVMLAALDIDPFHKRLNKSINTDHKNSIISQEK